MRDHDKDLTTFVTH